MKIIPRERLDRVEELYLSGHGEREIQRAVAEAYGVTRRQARNYLAKVKARLAERATATDQEAARAQILGMLRHTFRVAEQGSPEGGPNASAMVAAATRMAEVQGLMAPKKFEHSGTLAFDAAALNDRLTAFISGAAGAPLADPAPALPGAGEPGDPGGDRGGAGAG